MAALTRTYLALLILAACGICALAGEIREGTTVQVKPNSIWFKDTAKLTHWQRLKKSGDTAALAAYEGQVLFQRDAWQFTNPLAARVLSHKPKQGQVNVEMRTAGRMFGSRWSLDANALVPGPAATP